MLEWQSCLRDEVWRVDADDVSLRHAIATILCFGALGATATAFISSLGPQTGLRTMIITRFSSGYMGGTIYSLFNVLTQ